LIGFLESEIMGWEKVENFDEEIERINIWKKEPVVEMLFMTHPDMVKYTEDVYICYSCEIQSNNWLQTHFSLSSLQIWNQPHPPLLLTIIIHSKC
jgi:hypothetical protein